MIARYFLIVLFSCICAMISAQSDFSLRLNATDSLTDLSVFDSENLGAGQYRLWGTSYRPSSSDNSFWQVDVDEFGVQSNGILYEVSGRVDGGRNNAVGGSIYRWKADSTLHLLKTNDLGTAEWVRRFTIPLPMNFSNSTGTSTVTTNGKVITLGHGYTPVQTFGAHTLVIAVCDTNNTTTFIQGYDSNNPWIEGAEELLPLSNGGFLTGIRRRPVSSSGPIQFLIQRWDSNLNHQWSYQYNFSTFSYLASIDELADGGFFVTGRFRSNNVSGPTYEYRMKLDSSGNVLWCRTSTDSTDPIGWRTAHEQNDGTIILSGVRAVGHLTLRMDSTGQVLEAFEHPIAATYISASSYSPDTINDGFLITAVGPANEAYFIRLDSTLQDACSSTPIIWTDSVIAPSVNSVPFTFVNDTVVHTDTVWTTSPYVPFNVSDLCLTTGTQSIQQNGSIRVWPNPADEFLHVDCQTDEVYFIFSVRGELVEQGSTQNSSINIANMDEGMYLLLVGNDRSRRTFRFVKTGT